MSLSSGWSSQRDSRAGAVAGLVCVRCGGRVALRFDTDGCEACRAEGVPAALVADWALDEVDGAALWAEWAARPPGMWRQRELLPADADTAVSLAEGGTPLLEADGLLIKDERRNPTGSFKDRFFSVAVSWARRAGADTVAVASSGNAAVSLAAYAAAAGLDAVAVTTERISRTWRGLTVLHGARLEFAADAQERWELLRENADRWRVLTNTSEVPVSSLWVGIEGYKTIAYEIVRDLGAVPDVVTAPVSRGDGFMGMWRGFLELRYLGVTNRLPRMVAVERYPSLTSALDRGQELPPEHGAASGELATSIGNPQATVMSLQVIRQSGGTAVVCDDEQLKQAAARWARHGVAPELSSAAGSIGADEMRRRGELGAEETVVALCTAAAANQPDTLP